VSDIFLRFITNTGFAEGVLVKIFQCEASRVGATLLHAARLTEKQSRG